MGDGSGAGGYCEAYLSFEYTEKPRWRNRLDNHEQIPSVSAMLKQIGTYRSRFNKRKGKVEKRTPGTLRRTKRDLLLKFLLNVQQEEDIGVKESGKTEEIMDAIDRSDLKTQSIDSSGTDVGLESSGSNEMETNDSQSPPLESFPSLEAELPAIHAGSNEMETNDSQSPLLESFPSLEAELPAIHAQVSLTDVKPHKNENETRNLYKAYKSLAIEIKSAKKESCNTEDFLTMVGLLDVQSCIIDTHCILMEDVVNDNETLPGKFSTNIRAKRYKGEDHEYPQFISEEVGEMAVNRLIEVYNEMIDKIKSLKVPSDEQILKLTFKCASVFLFTFLELHPFGDGNGRLARLLTSYSLWTFSPFMTPIYNVFSSSRESDYMDALVQARRSLESFPLIENEETAVSVVDKILRQTPSDLCAMLIESNWTMWRQLLVRLGDKTIKLYHWEGGCENQRYHCCCCCCCCCC